jgi:Type II secretion system protein B
MSYILDALTKAAKQRERQVPVVQRLLSPPAPTSPWVRVPGRPRAALAVGGVLLAVLVIWWLRPVPSVGPPDQSSVMPAATPTPTLTPRPVTVEPARPSGRLEPMPRVDAQVETPSPRGRQAIADAPVPPARPATSPAPGFRALATQPQAAAPVEPPAAAARPAPPAERSGLRLEALIYSDLPAQRMVFINGRRYAEGDVVDGRLRVEEIQEEGVELSDQGRRFTLRATR